jgi:hypothetical protein
MFIERYFKEPIKYAISDWKKIFVGGVFGLIFYDKPPRKPTILIVIQNKVL